MIFKYKAKLFDVSEDKHTNSVIKKCCKMHIIKVFFFNKKNKERKRKRRETLPIWM